MQILRQTRGFNKRLSIQSNRWLALSTEIRNWKSSREAHERRGSVGGCSRKSIFDPHEARADPLLQISFPFFPILSPFELG
jgi:hypothetical protein